ncbi:glycosyl transferase family 1 [Tamlana sp. 2_MG-2023]|uniref:glycosyltransferase n=1 Tax=unclassified Tamlana TaxID=2614803 RepID=UPI0026E21C34|nr:MULTISPECIES: glycosyltransferase [unclassified Tamlana]MDO6759392.1 glycosyl transferase family 1 [Tamlana sp. 2_MG-2023]MDO6790469.1 glycosyl transferase family 1 [Tamlana sp. 1_MG-2023]
MKQKKVLIITYYWPPAGGPGVQRWLKFVKYLPEFDVEPIVYVPENANYPLTDESLNSEVSSALTVIKQPIKEPYKLAGILSKKSSKTISKGIISEEKKQSVLEKLMLFVRGNFFIPDARVGWVRPSVAYLSDYIKKEAITTVITTGPPHSIHLIGLQLKEKLRVNWLADFRDPWTTIGYHKQLKLTATSEKKHKSFEKQVLNTADQIIVTSFTTKAEFQNITNKPIEVITNGYDDEGSVSFEMDSKFTLAHIGSLLSKRNPEILWRALSELINENIDFSEDFQLNFIGEVSENVANSIKDHNLSNYVNDVGYVSHKESITFQKKSQILLLIEIDSEETKCIIPGKLFEYMVSNRPIVAIGPKGWDVEKIIKETNTGNCFNYNDFDHLKNTILEHYYAFKKGKLQTHPIGLQKYHRKALTKSLSKML